jgi:hypothetical protein
MLRSYRPDSLPRMLVTAMNKKIFNMEVLDEDGSRRFTIFRDERFGGAKRSSGALPVPEQQAESQFAKK